STNSGAASPLAVSARGSCSWTWTRSCWTCATAWRTSWPTTIAALKDAWKRLYRAKNNGRAGNTAAALQALEDAYPHESCILALVAHIRRSAEGKHGRYRESFRKDNARTNPAR
ncbi:MAG: hypothetical protein AAGL98_07145, partial [Planctomycetota bacterium]